MLIWFRVILLCYRVKIVKVVFFGVGKYFLYRFWFCYLRVVFLVVVFYGFLEGFFFFVIFCCRRSIGEELI